MKNTSKRVQCPGLPEAMPSVSILREAKRKNIFIGGMALLWPCILYVFTGCSGDNDIIIYNQVAGYGVSLELASAPVSTRAIVKFNPEESVTRVEYALGKETDRDDFIAGTYPGINSVAGNAAFEITFDGLEPETAYTVFAKGHNNNGETSVSSVEFNTFTANFSVTREYVSDVSAAYRITCTTDYTRFSYAMGKASDKEMFVNGTLDGITTQEEAKVYVAHDFELEPETDYVFYCMGYDRLNNPTILFEEPFTTTASSGYPDVTFSADANIYQGIYTFVPNELCGKITATAYLEGYGLETSLFHRHTWYGDLFKVLENWAANVGQAVSETGDTLIMGLQTYELPLHMKIHVYVVIYDNDLKPYCAKHYVYTTPSYNRGAGKAAVEVEIMEVLPTEVKLAFTMNENTLGVMYDIFTAGTFEEILTGIENGTYDKYVIHDYFVANYYIYSWIYDYSYLELSYSYQFEGGDYYVVAAPMNANGPALGWGELAYEKFTVVVEEDPGDDTGGEDPGGDDPIIIPGSLSNARQGEKIKLYKL